MSRRLIIGIRGNKGQGKDSITNFIVERYFNEFSRVRVDKFAAPIYTIVADIIGIPAKEFMHYPLKKEEYLHFPFDKFRIRDMLQIVGESFRDRDPQVWIKSWAYRMNRDTISDLVIVSDLRNNEEMQAIKNAGGFIIHTFGRDTGLPKDSHKTENAPVDFDLVDYEIMNSYGLDHLKKETYDIMHDILGIWNT